MLYGDSGGIYGVIAVESRCYSSTEDPSVLTDRLPFPVLCSKAILGNAWLWDGGHHVGLDPTNQMMLFNVCVGSLYFIFTPGPTKLGYEPRFSNDLYH